MEINEVSFSWRNGDDEYATEVFVVMSSGITDADVNVIGPALEDWASSKAGTPVTFRSANRETLVAIEIDPVTP